VDFVIVIRTPEASELLVAPVALGEAILMPDPTTPRAWAVTFRTTSGCAISAGAKYASSVLRCSFGKLPSAVASTLPTAIRSSHRIEIFAVPHDRTKDLQRLIATSVELSPGWSDLIEAMNVDAKPRLLAEQCVDGSAMQCEEAAGFAKDPVETRRLQMLACRKGSRDSCILIAHHALATPPKLDADRFAIFETTCNGGALFACKHALANLNAAAGALVDERLEPMYVGACETGDDDACAEAGRLTLAKDSSRAAGYLSIGCSKAIGTACFSYAELLERGDGTKKDGKEASRLYGVACELAHAAACAKVGKPKLACELAHTASCDALCKSGEFHSCRHASDDAQTKFGKTAADNALAGLFAKCEERRKKIASGDVPKKDPERKAFVKSCEATHDELDAAIDMATPSDLARYKKLTMEKETRCGECPKSE